MNIKKLISGFLALAAMIGLVVAAMAVLNRVKEASDPVHERYRLAYAVPSNAVMVCVLSGADGLTSPVLSPFEFHQELAGFMDSRPSMDIAKNGVAVSLHYSGSLTPLYVFDAGKDDQAGEDALALMEFARQHDYQAEFVNCSDLVQEGPLAERSVVLLAKTKAQLRISKSHISEGRSVMDAEGFKEVAESAPSDVLFFSYGQAKVLFEKAVLRSYYRTRFSGKASAEYSDAATFFTNVADWGTISLDGGLSFDLLHEYGHGSDFLTVFTNDYQSESEVACMLPNYTRFALTMPMQDDNAYIEAYEEYLEGVQKNIVYQQWRDKIKKKTGMAPEAMLGKLGVTEVATAAFECGGKMEWINLLKVDRADTVLLRGTGESGFGKSPKVYPYAFSESIASVYGKYFRLPEESHFTYLDEWVITGSRKAVEEYAGGMALSYDLETYMSDAGESDLIADKDGACVIYLNVPKGDAWLNSLMGEELCTLHDALKGDAEYAPFVMTVSAKDENVHASVACHHLKLSRSRAPKFNRDTLVNVPAGPFEVINSGTGRKNLFYQRSNGAISLKEVDGKGIWGVPFKKKLCGTACNIDYNANGNLQILFGAGSELYVIDRTGRFVGGFPVDLGKEILLGPDVYDFNGDNTYDVMVLHKDNTIEMYGLRGQKPQSWKGIVPPADNTIKSLPEKLTVGDKTVWVVRTSMQTLIYPFDGGSPLNSQEGDKMFLPAAEVIVKNATTVEARCYDGKTRTVKIK